MSCIGDVPQSLRDVRDVGSTCADADARLRRDRAVVCRSLVGDQTIFCPDDVHNVTASGDWPSQVVYFLSLLEDVTSPGTCANTSYYYDTILWLNRTIIDSSLSGSFGWTWDVFQPQYYDMPRKAGDRVEAPDTLGRKCWAFAYLDARWDTLEIETKVPFDLSNLTKHARASRKRTMDLCDKVQANCFVNATYDPTRNGTCKTKQFEYHYLGFDRENLKRGNPIRYPFY